MRFTGFLVYTYLYANLYLPESFYDTIV